MPNPKDYMDDDHEFVQGYARRKSGETPTMGRRRRSWFWRIAWYWRLLIVFGLLKLRWIWQQRIWEVVK